MPDAGHELPRSGGHHSSSSREPTSTQSASSLAYRLGGEPRLRAGSNTAIRHLRQLTTFTGINPRARFKQKHSAPDGDELTQKIPPLNHGERAVQLGIKFGLASRKAEPPGLSPGARSEDFHHHIGSAVAPVEAGITVPSASRPAIDETPNGFFLSPGLEGLLGPSAWHRRPRRGRFRVHPSARPAAPSPSFRGLSAGASSNCTGRPSSSGPSLPGTTISTRYRCPCFGLLHPRPHRDQLGKAIRTPTMMIWMITKGTAPVDLGRLDRRRRHRRR